MPACFALLCLPLLSSTLPCQSVLPELDGMLRPIRDSSFRHIGLWCSWARLARRRVDGVKHAPSLAWSAVLRRIPSCMFLGLGSSYVPLVGLCELY